MKLLKRLFKLIIALCIVSILIIVLLYSYAYFSPKLDIKNANQFYIYDDKENLVYQGSGNNDWVSLKEISPNLINAVLSTEDKNFYKHHGFDIERGTSGKVAGLNAKEYKKKMEEEKKALDKKLDKMADEYNKLADHYNHLLLEAKALEERNIRKAKELLEERERTR